MHKYYCPRCMVGMVMLGKRKMQFLPEIIGFSDYLPVEVHICPECGKIETFADFDGSKAALDSYIGFFADCADTDTAKSKFACPNCGEEFSPSLLKCPKCGLDMRKPNSESKADTHERELQKPKRKLPWEF